MDLRPPPKRSQNDKHDINALFAWLEDHYRIFDQYVSVESGILTFDFNRPKFRYKDTDEIYIGAGSYFHSGSQAKQLVYWDSELTFAFGSGGSNSDSTNLAQSDWFYLYLDDSAIIAAQTPLLTASEFVAVTTEPAWDVDKAGWYNGNDRCIMGFRSSDSAATVRIFYHDGGTYWHWDTRYQDLADTDIDTTWTAVTLTLPVYSNVADVLFRTFYGGSGNSRLYYRVKGSSTNGTYTGKANSLTRIMFTRALVMTDDNKQIEIKHDASDDNESGVHTTGYLLGRGI